MAQYFNSSECTTLAIALTMTICKTDAIREVIHKSPHIITVREEKEKGILPAPAKIHPSAALFQWHIAKTKLCPVKISLKRNFTQP